MKIIQEIKGKCYQQNNENIPFTQQLDLFAHDIWKTIKSRWISKLIDLY